MRLKQLEISGFKSFAKKTLFSFESPITAIVGPNGSGKSNVVEAFRFVLGEQSMKSLRGKKGEDLIFSGNSGRQNRASVKVLFDNRDRKLNIDFAEVEISRAVGRDGVNEYAVNGSQVKLRDIWEILSGLALGPQTTSIINQGETDRILLANPKDRREMIEEALGLRVYLWEIATSEKKLSKTEENIKQTESLRREIAPHLRFLKKQVEQVRQMDIWRSELKVKYLEYLKRENKYLGNLEMEIKKSKEKLLEEYNRNNLRFKELEFIKENYEGVDSFEEKTLSEINNTLKSINEEKNELLRRLGRIEGVLEIKEDKTQSEEIKQFVSSEELNSLIKEADDYWSKLPTDIASYKDFFSWLKDKLNNLIKTPIKEVSTEAQNQLSNLQKEKEEIIANINLLEEKIRQEEEKKVNLQKKIEKANQDSRFMDKEYYELRARQTELNSKLDLLSSKEEKLTIEKENWQREIDEALVLVDREILEYENLGPDVSNEEPRSLQEERRRAIEKIKIRLEDAGVDRNDVYKEYQEVSQRDKFLEKEIIDLRQASQSLLDVIKELKIKVNNEFNEGLVKINKEFQHFFSLMFGGGSVSLDLEEINSRRSLTDEELMENDDEEAETQIGLTIKVNLPRKKIKSLEMLSGGERALISIALLFAVSRINPPPFLILDETDAALDESNSRRYSDMIEELAKSSQLILVTHNRETMSRAGVLYGVTMDSDGISRLLSIKFEEAENYAKR
ncbi:MAG TPA: hypothetical protein ENN31_01530 [Candidatus Vogelbacteria bacterium]|nr:hypothetical protein [Candidatus Vogelbacteria bacterium]